LALLPQIHRVARRKYQANLIHLLRKVCPFHHTDADWTESLPMNLPDIVLPVTFALIVASTRILFALPRRADAGVVAHWIGGPQQVVTIPRKQDLEFTGLHGGG